MILSGEDAFWASDRYGEVKSQPSDHERRLRRATTINCMSPSLENKRWSGHIVAVSPDAERKRSSTFPSNTPVPNQITESPAKPQSRHIRSLSTGRPQRGSYVPLLVRHRRMNWATRPRSQEELGPLKECPSPQLRGPTSIPQPRDSTSMGPKHEQPNRISQCNCGCHEGVQSSQPSHQHPVHVQKSRPAYADAGIQTDDDPVTEPPPKSTTRYDDDSQGAYGEHRAEYTDSSGFGFQPNTYSQRSSMYSESCSSNRSSWYVANPIMMGRMQDYFRSTEYFLGDSLRPQGMG